MKWSSKLTAFLSIIKNSTKKAILNRKFVMVILIMIFVSGAMTYSTTQDIERLEMGSTFFDLLVISFFLPVTTMIFGSSLLRDEIEDKSITQLLTSPLSRVEIFFAFYISTFLVSMISMWLIVTSGFVTYFGIMGMDLEALKIYLSVGALVTIGSLVYTSLFLSVSVLISRAIYFGLFYVFIWEGFIGSLPGKIKLLSIRHYIRSIEKDWISYGAVSYYDIASEALLSFEVLIFITAALLILGALLFRRKEFL